MTATHTRAAAHVQGGRFFVLGITDTEMGPIPFAFYCEAPGAPDGRVDIGAEKQHPAVKDALAQSEGGVSNAVEREKIKLTAADLVDRARDGDQNAMDMLGMIGQNARNGNPRARFAYHHCMAYMKRTPVRKRYTPGHSSAFAGGQRDVQARGLLGTMSTAMAQNEPRHYSAAIITLLPSLLAVADLDDAAVIASCGPSLLGDSQSNQYLASVEAEFQEGPSHTAFNYAFTHGRRCPPGEAVSDELQAACAAGYILGMARRIQLVRLPDTPVSILSPSLVFELGE